jgi:hypothetical protein
MEELACVLKDFFFFGGGGNCPDPPTPRSRKQTFKGFGQLKFNKLASAAREKWRQRPSE